jgi:uncharacterized membrane protein
MTGTCEDAAHVPFFIFNFTVTIYNIWPVMKPESTMMRIWTFYRDGFRSMTVGRTLWLLIAIKLFIMFAILKIFFFPRFLGRFDTDAEREEYVRQQLIERTDNQSH